MSGGDCPSVLVVDDDALFGRSIRRDLEREGFRANVAHSSDVALAMLDRQHVDVLLSDLRMPGFNGLSLVATATARGFCKLAFVVSGHLNKENAAQAAAIGAAGAFEKPVNHRELVRALRSHLDSQAFAVSPAMDVAAPSVDLTATPDSLPESPRARPAPLLWRDQYAPFLVGESAAMQRLFSSLMKVSDVESNVLILGESGTGKELVSRALHAAGSRANGPFVPLNCAAIPAELAESELFGFSKGAFTGALTSRAGRFAAANKGTIFLDEIGEMDLATQAKVLRVIQEREFTPVGETMPQKANVRLIAATNRDLRFRVDEKRFREDLFYRLSVIVLRLPPLRERKSDIPLLLQSVITRVNKAAGRKVTGVTDAVMSRLCLHDWPGNVREFENTVERLVVTTREGPITEASLDDCDFVERRLGEPTGHVVASLPSLVPKPAALSSAVAPVVAEPLDESPEAFSLDLRAEIEKVEINLIKRALRASNGNQKKAAELLKVNRTTLIEKLRRFQIRDIT